MASTMALAAIAASMESVEGFSTGVSRTSNFAAPANFAQRRANPLHMASEAQDEIAKLKEMAAKAREDAARLAKVSREK